MDALTLDPQSVYAAYVEGAAIQTRIDCGLNASGVDGDGTSAQTQSFLWICGCLVFFLQAGFACLEAGSIGSTSVTNVLFKNFCDAMIGAPVWWAVGYAFAFGTGAKFIGDEGFFMINVNPCDQAMWFYQWTFAATCSTIISGAMAGRTQLAAYLVYSVVVTAFIYPVIVHWTWSGNAWLADKGYIDFAGSGIVHVTGGTAGLVGAYLVGPRGTDLFENYKNKHDIEGHSMPLVAVGTLILIFGFFGFNGGSVLAMDSVGNAIGLTTAVINTILAASGGALSASIWNNHVNKYWSLMQACNGCIAGMVAVCAGADRVDTWAAFVIGIVGGISFKGWSHIVHRAGIDDAVDAFAVHAGAGMWGVLAAAMFDNTSGAFYAKEGFETFGWHLLGIVIIVSWTASTSFIMFSLLKSYGFLRVDDEAIENGVDKSEHGEWAYVYDQREIISWTGAKGEKPLRGVSTSSSLGSEKELNVFSTKSGDTVVTQIV